MPVYFEFFETQQVGLNAYKKNLRSLNSKFNSILSDQQMKVRINDSIVPALIYNASGTEVPHPHSVQLIA